MNPSADTLPLDAAVLTALLQQSEQGLAVFDAHDRLVQANPAFRAFFGLHAQEWPSWVELMRLGRARGSGVRVVTDDFEAWLASARTRRGKLPFRAFESDLQDGRWIHVTETTLPSGAMWCVMTDISALGTAGRQVRLERDLALRAATVDALTGVNSRSYVMERLRASLAATPTPAPLVVALLDLDHFKRVNDRLGHGSGDAVLRHFGAQLQALVRRDDVAGRLGGEEFVLLLPGIDVDSACSVVARLLQAVRDARPLAEHPDFGYTCSAGVAASQPGDTPEALLKRADQALYAAKAAGRDRCTRAEHGA
jgi:diguanylate cyclase (GGDEF)-like protein